MKVKLNKQSEQLLKMGSILKFPDKDNYHYFPFWLRRNEEDKLYEYDIIPFEYLPKKVKDKVKQMREI